MVQERLGRELEARDGNVRRLARDIAQVTNAKGETVRRAVYRILNGGMPSPDTSRLLESGLGKPAGYFTVQPLSRTRSVDRLAELEAAFVAFVEATTLRLAALEAALAREAPQSKPRQARARRDP